MHIEQVQKHWNIQNDWQFQNKTIHQNGSYLLLFGKKKRKGFEISYK